MRVYYDNVIYPNFGGTPYFSKMQEKEEYLPVYTYTGIENVVILVDDEIHSTDYATWWFDVRWMEGEQEMWRKYDTLREMYEDLPKGTYYISFHLEIFGNYVYGKNGNYIGQESTNVVPVFILELK